MSQGFDDIVDRLREVAGDLDDRSFTMLREAVAAKQGRPAADKTLMQARRALEKAIHLLQHVDDPRAATDDVDD
jgi:hypothetical protein